MTTTSSSDAPAHSGPLSFFTKTLSRWATFSFGLVTLITVSCAGYDYFLLEQEKSASIAKQDRDEKNGGVLIELVGLQKQIEIDIIQVQQFLSDFSATRGQDGNDGGLTNAAKFAARFSQDIIAARKAAEACGNQDLVDAFSQLERRFPGYYAQGVEMAKVYAGQGTSAGNKLVVAFDKTSDEMQEKLDLSSTALDFAKQRHAQDAAIANAQIDQFRNRATTVALGGVGITAITCLIGIFIFRYWVIQPLSWVTFTFKKLAGGDPSYDVYDIARYDEIGDLSRAYSEFRQVTVERQGFSRETHMLSLLNEWLQSCKTLDELYETVAKFLTRLLPNCSGCLYIYANSRDVLDSAKVWNGGEITSAMHPDDCWGLRRGRTFIYGEDEIDFHCAHVSPSMSTDYCCIPILAHGETIGLLHLGFDIHLASGDEKSRKNIIDKQRRLGIVCAEQISMAIANVKLRDQLRDQSIRDALTGLFNRRYLLEACRREFSRAARMSQNVSILSIDVDHFKKYNDNHGHDAGDTVLRAVGECLEKSFRNEDIACRFGGEEFIVVLSGAIPEDAAGKADELRSKVESLVVRYLDRALPRITISVGIATFPDCGDNPQAVIKAADEALYRAKANGRNRVELSSSLSLSIGISTDHAIALRQTPETSFSQSAKNEKRAGSLGNAA
jgi:diguanylate cyclase (GGDEF)-like protein